MQWFQYYRLRQTTGKWIRVVGTGRRFRTEMTTSKDHKAWQRSDRDAVDCALTLPIAQLEHHIGAGEHKGDGVGEDNGQRVDHQSVDQPTEDSGRKRAQHVVRAPASNPKAVTRSMVTSD